MKKVLLFVAVCFIISSISGCTALKQAIESRAEEEKELMRGTYKGSVYTSEFANLAFTAPDGWEYQSEEELREVIGMGMEMTGDETPQETVDKYVVYDMMVVNPNTGTNIMIMYSNMQGIKMTEEEYLDSLIEDMIDEQVYNYEIGDVYDAMIAEDLYKALYLEIPDFGAFQYCNVRKMGKYMLSIIISVFGEDDIADILDHFSAVETEQ